MHKILKKLIFNLAKPSFTKKICIKKNKNMHFKSKNPRIKKK